MTSSLAPGLVYPPRPPQLVWPLHVCGVGIVVVFSGDHHRQCGIGTREFKVCVAPVPVPVGVSAGRCIFAFARCTV